jgi:Trp operon repressor
MPHLSKTKLADDTLRSIDDGVVTFLTSTTGNTRKFIFKEMITKTERLMIAKRLAILLMLEKEKSIREICETLKVSPSTVARYQLSFENGAFKRTRQWLEKRYVGNNFLKLLLQLAEVPFEAQKKSLGQMLDEN